MTSYSSYTVEPGPRAPAPPPEPPSIAGRRLYVCTPAGSGVVDFVKRCLAGGVDVVQLREKHLDARPLVKVARQVAAVCRDQGVPFIMNDRADLALDAGADGVHLGQDDPEPALARKIMGASAIIGLSTHSPMQAQQSRNEPVDYISAGPVEETPTKPGRPGTGLGYIGVAAAFSGQPVFVTGGVRPERVRDLAAAGAKGFVVVRYLTEAPDPEKAARVLRDAIDEALQEPISLSL